MRVSTSLVLIMIGIICIFNQSVGAFMGVSPFGLIGALSFVALVCLWVIPAVGMFRREPKKDANRRFLRRPML
jgi:hypothetical protein